MATGASKKPAIEGQLTILQKTKYAFGLLKDAATEGSNGVSLSTRFADFTLALLICTPFVMYLGIGIYGLALAVGWQFPALRQSREELFTYFPSIENLTPQQRKNHTIYGMVVGFLTFLTLAHTIPELKQMLGIFSPATMGLLFGFYFGPFMVAICIAAKNKFQTWTRSREQDKILKIIKDYTPQEHRPNPSSMLSAPTPPPSKLEQAKDVLVDAANSALEKTKEKGAKLKQKAKKARDGCNVM